jgi:hypothetical protein
VHALSIPKIGSDETSSKKNDLLLLFPREIGSFTSQKKKKKKFVDAWDGCSISSFYFIFHFLFFFPFILFPKRVMDGWIGLIWMSVCSI